jgi:alpha-L-rhamnosidase
MSRPTHLRAEHLDHPLGLGEPRPRLSWRLPAGSARQTAYELSDSAGATAVVASDACVLVPWPGRPLAPGERRSVRVRVRTEAGLSDWSEPLAVEAGLLGPGDWRAAWAEPADVHPGPAGSRPAYRLRGEFEVRGEVAVARLYVTAHGIVEPWLDGARVGDQELLPGYTQYAARTQVTTYDVSRLPTTTGCGGCTTRRCGASAATPATFPPTAPPGSGPAGPVTGSCTCPPRRSSTTSPGSR